MILAHQRINTAYCIECNKRPSSPDGEGDERLYCMACNHNIVQELVRRSKLSIYDLYNNDFKKLPGKRQCMQQANKKVLKKDLLKKCK